ncbi:MULTISPECIES: dihydroorotate dehydrogenase electron transfer subunit [Caproicibacterium]|jgi:dihydroorotate dehydrogenase electron transfer subunit|uniref:Dihydroorotate dehydrogenase B (NAD(+)), electron transfer subunit n=1 Tax=Caproicibacterium lactatifermentans TaxID=2666138 RepID=A0A859DQU4_9FIRM|nr:dihydroorotate dehydrogenase electron transfer subunit [Caproicibacterium lactatifermentans]ARP49805.1 oxidoreductase [Ruminococcaceae bacterium CPB6]MDD4807076.1 dihydroorotate dehydrogenase electron transfer subunit [Oscillospiraceae bacterium]QKN24467.1 dihydroorotate dehydrogenase electron transfer subunit [Caproicibacterium lactatifermentans]QKO30520.1 dihydroorotate dehydrogenase electron transfer subunit [Caproicibacterium lactatifermentans]
MKYDIEICPVLARQQLTADIFSLTVSAPKLAPLAKAGQFAQIRIPGKVLRRPISICGIGPDTLRFVVQVRGEGTQQLSEVRPGDSLDILAPLGNGFPQQMAEKRAVFVGGGIGVPPLLGAATAFSGEKTAVLGFRSREAVILADDFTAAGCRVHLATDDGSAGFHGLVTGVLQTLSFDVCCACGPLPMLRAVAALCAERKVPCWVSMEQRMACGVGACLGCATALYRPDGSQYYGHVCKDGPVFPASRIAWEQGVQ